MDASLIVSAIVCAIVVVSAIVALFRWVGKVDANTSATERLTLAFESYTVKTDDRYIDHEKRITSLEAGHGLTPPPPAR